MYTARPLFPYRLFYFPRIKRADKILRLAKLIFAFRFKTENIGSQGEKTQQFEDFKLLLLISHYLATRSACQSQKSLEEMEVRILEMLRYPTM